MAGVERICIRCGKLFRVSESSLAHGKGKHCSRKCRTYGRTLHCKTCGKPFYANGNEVKTGRKFCSAQCSYQRHGRRIYSNGDGTATIELTQGYEAVIDESDLPLVEGRSWQSWKHRRTVYPASGTGPTKTLLHQILMNAPKGMVVDHIDGNGLNNRRSNLRIVTNGVNLRNTYKHRARRENRANS